MGFSSAKNIIATVADSTPAQFDDWCKSWRAAVTAGSTEPLLTFIAREGGLAEDVFLQRLAAAIGWPFIDLHKHVVPAETRNKISTKVAFQYSVLPAAVNGDALQLVTSDPFDAAMINAVRFDTQMPVEFALAPRNEIEKALKKYYGVGAETLDELGEGEAMDLDIVVTRKSPRTTRRPASSSSSTRSSGRRTRTARRTFISSRRRTSCASATALTAFCTRRRCRRS